MRRDQKLNIRSILYRNGLSTVFLILFLFTLIAQTLTGRKQRDKDLEEAHQAEIDLPTYLKSCHFISSTFENLES